MRNPLHYSAELLVKKATQQTAPIPSPAASPALGSLAAAKPPIPSQAQAPTQPAVQTTMPPDKLLSAPKLTEPNNKSVAPWTDVNSKLKKDWAATHNK